MERWHVPFDYIETHWTASQFVLLVAAVVESDKAAKRKQGAGGNKPRYIDALHDMGL